VARMNRTEALRVALAEVWSGADRIDAEAVLDHLSDQGYEVVQIPAARRAAEERGTVDELPLASTRPLGKRRSA
jgi:hypothetical protein